MDESFYLQTIAHLTHCSVSLLNKSLEIELSLSGWKDETNPLIADKELCSNLISAAQDEGICLYNDIQSIFFGVVEFTGGRYVIIGPCSESEVSPAAVQEFARKHRVKMRPINRITFSELNAALGQIYHISTGKVVSFFDLSDKVVKSDLDTAASEQILKVMTHHYETVEPHNDGSWEIIRRKCIMNGDLEGIERHRNAPYSGKRGVVGPNKLRSGKNLAIVDVTVSSRAALDAGLDSETVYTVSDGYLLQIEQCQSENEADTLAHKAALEFAKMVIDLKEQQNFTISRDTNAHFIRARDFIIRHIYSRLTLEYIARENGISVDYLEAIFKKELGKSVMAFVVDQKIEQSIKLMKQEKLSLENIVNMLGYSSMSNFIDQFKRRKGVTPGKFRRNLLNKYVCTTPLT